MKVTNPTLPDSAKKLMEINIDLQKKMSSMRERYEKEIDLLHEQISLLRSQKFGRNSEKASLPGGPQPLFLFDMPEPDPDQEDDDEDKQKKTIHVPGHDRKVGGRKPLPEDLPRINIIHDIADDQKVCTCGCELKRIGEEVSEKLDIIPAKIQVERHIRPKYACPACEGVEDDGPTVKIAPVPARIIPKSIVSPGLLAYILTGKFIDHTPFYRQVKQFTRLGLELSRTTMCRWAMRAATACQPLLELVQNEISSGNFINIDETTLQVLKEPGRSPTQKSYMWIFRRGDPEHPALIYQYHSTRSGNVAFEFLRGFSGTVQTDGYAGYNFLDRLDDVRHIACWAHVRRKFMDIVKSQGKKRKPGAADKALSYIGKLYRIEKLARSQELACDKIHAMRQEQAKPILDNFLKWLQIKSTQTPPKGLLGKAVKYALGQWDRLVGYIEDGELTIDNNMAENSIRPFVIGRKNWLFAGNPEGAAASATLYSLIETAKANNLEPYAYLRYIFEKLPLATSAEDQQALLPWNLSSVKISVPSGM